MKTKTVTVTVTVKAPVRMKAAAVAKLIGMCIDIGMADAAETAEDPDLDSTDADKCLSLEVEKVEAV